MAVSFPQRRPQPESVPAGAFDEVSLAVRGYSACRPFYEATLGALGFEVVLDWRDRSRAWFGLPGDPSRFLLSETRAPGGITLAFAALDRDAVDAFYAEGLHHGLDAGEPPQFRDEYHAGYYSAGVRDPEGNLVQAVCRRA